MTMVHNVLVCFLQLMSRIVDTQLKIIDVRHVMNYFSEPFEKLLAKLNTLKYV